MNRQDLKAARLPGLMLAAQLALLAFTIFSAHAGWGRVHTVLHVAVPTLMAGIVMVWAMHLRQRSGLVRMTAAIGFVFWLLLVGLSIADLLTRERVPPPW